MSVIETVRPRVMVAPEYTSSAGQEAIELAALAGLVLDPWEALVLEHALAEGADGRWAAAEVGLCVPRQNGKNAVLEARELAALFLLGERLTIHSAQQFKTAKEHFLRLLGLIEATPELDRRVKRVVRAHGEEAIELRNGQRILFLSRTKSSGRGFSAPLVVFDEAMFLAESSMGALVPTMSAMPNRQRWYAGSAVDQFVHADGVVFARVRERAIRGGDSRLAYFEWSLDAERPELLDPALLADEDAWAAANPGLGIRITTEAVADELRSLDRRTFAVERLGVGDWPATDPDADQVIQQAAWLALVDEGSELEGPIAFAFDVTPDRASASIAAAGRRPDGLFHVEITHHRRGTAWVVPELTRLREQWTPVAVMGDATGPAGSLVYRCEESGFDVEAVNAGDHAKACGLLVDLVGQEQLRHLGSGELSSALRGATKRPLGDAWAWSRKNSAVDISPLVAATLALWGAATLGGALGRDPGDLVKPFGWLRRQSDPGQERLEMQRGWFEAELAGWQGWYGLSPQAAERVWVANRCIHLNANQISSMDLRFETSAPAGKSTPTWVDPGPDPLWYPNGVNDAVYSIISSMYAYGDAFLFVTARYADGYPSGWTVIDPRAVQVELVGGQRVYRIHETPVDPGDVVHVLRDPVAGQLRGTPALRSYGPYVQGLLAGAASAANLAANPIPNAILKSEQKLTEEQAREIQDQWVERAGMRRGAPAVLPPKLDFELLAFSPKDLLLLDAQQWDAKVIASAFGVPVFLLNMAVEGNLVYQNPASLGEFWWRFELYSMALSVSRSLSRQMLPRGDSVVFDASEMFAPLDQPVGAAEVPAPQPAQIGGDVVPLKPAMGGI